MARKTYAARDGTRQRTARSTATQAVSSVAARNQAWSGQQPGDSAYPPMPVVREDRPLLTNIGASGTAIFSGIVTSEEYNPDFYWRDGVRIYEEMLRNDGQVNAVREMIELPIHRATASIEPGSASTRDREIASFVETCLFEDMRYTTSDGGVECQSWESIVQHILLHLWYGFSTFEQVWRIEDGWVKWARWTPLLPRTIWRWWVGDDNALVGVQQWTFKQHTYQFVDIPARKLITFHRRMEGQNYEGVSLLRSAYKHWFYKVQFEKVESVGIERNAVIPPVISLPEGFTNEDVLQAQAIGANIRANAQIAVTLPPGWSLEYPRNFQHGAVQVQQSIQYHDVLIARNALCQFINLGATQTGAYALDESQRHDLLENLQAVCAYIEGVINSGPIRQLVDYNYSGVGVYPKLRFGKIAASDIAKLADALSKLANAGLLHPDAETEDYLRASAGLPRAPRDIITAYNPTAPENASRPDNGSRHGHRDAEPRDV
ncbi:MAG: phage portal protein family protein [Ktedonobacterales bacterium]